VLRLVANRRLVPLATPPLFLEYEDVLKRPEQRIAHGLTLEMVDEILAEVAALVEPMEFLRNAPHVPPEPEDMR
jgi:hypothetical protein